MIRVEDLEIFSGKIEPHDFGSLTPCGFLEGDPQKVVRNLASFKQRGSMEEIDLRYAQVINAWTEFGCFQGIRVPRFTAYRNFFVVVDFVEGESLDKKQFTGENPEENITIGRFLGSLADYADDKCHNGGVYLSDQKPQQYMYGTTIQESSPGVYFVDLDYEMGVIDPEDLYDLAIPRLFFGISKVFRGVDRKFDPQTFSQERMRLQELIKEARERYNSHILGYAWESLNV